MHCAQGIQANGPDLSRSRLGLDFGAGFYVTTRKIRALEWALLACKRPGELPAVMCWDIGYDDFASAPKLAFAEAGRSATEFWAFVRFNRRVRQAHRRPPLGDFDMVVGPASQNHRAEIPVPEMDQVSFHTDPGLSLLRGGMCSVTAVRVRPVGRSSGPTGSPGGPHVP